MGFSSESIRRRDSAEHQLLSAFLADVTFSEMSSLFSKEVYDPVPLVAASS
jgi:hypothetical protein